MVVTQGHVIDQFVKETHQVVRTQKTDSRHTRNHLITIACLLGLAVDNKIVATACIGVFAINMFDYFLTYALENFMITMRMRKLGITVSDINQSRAGYIEKQSVLTATKYFKFLRKDTHR